MPRNICYDLSTLKRILKKWLLLEILKRQDFCISKTLQWIVHKYLIFFTNILWQNIDIWYHKELSYLIAIDFVARISFLQQEQALRKFALFEQKQNRRSRMRYLNFDRKGRTTLIPSDPVYLAFLPGILSFEHLRAYPSANVDV